MNSNGFKTRDRSLLVQEELKRNNRLDRAEGDLGGAILISAYKNQNKTQLNLQSLNNTLINFQTGIR